MGHPSLRIEIQNSVATTRNQSITMYHPSLRIEIQNSATLAKNQSIAMDHSSLRISKILCQYSHKSIYRYGLSTVADRNTIFCRYGQESSHCYGLFVVADWNIKFYHYGQKSIHRYGSFVVTNPHTLFFHYGQKSIYCYGSSVIADQNTRFYRYGQKPIHRYGLSIVAWPPAFAGRTTLVFCSTCSRREDIDDIEMYTYPSHQQKLGLGSLYAGFLESSHRSGIKGIRRDPSQFLKSPIGSVKSKILGRSSEFCNLTISPNNHRFHLNRRF